MTSTLPPKVEAEQVVSAFAAETGRTFMFADLTAWADLNGHTVSVGRLREALVVSGNKASSPIVRVRHGVYVHKDYQVEDVRSSRLGQKKNSLRQAILVFARDHGSAFGHYDLISGVHLRGGAWSRTNISSTLIALSNDTTAPIARLDRGLYAHTGGPVADGVEVPSPKESSAGDLLVSALLPPTGYNGLLTVMSLVEQIEFFIGAWAKNYGDLELTPIHAYLWLTGWHEAGVDAAAVMSAFHSCEHMLDEVRPGVFAVPTTINADDPAFPDLAPAFEDLTNTTMGRTVSGRDRKMADMRAEGQTLEAIGEEFGLTRERVRQIVVGLGVTNASVRQGRADRAASENRVLTQRVVDHFRHNSHQSLAEVAEDMGIPMDILRAAVPRRLALMIGQPNVWTVCQFSDGDIAEALGKAAALLGEPLSAKTYRGAVLDGRIVGPSVPLLNVRYGTWSKACKLAGVTPGDPPPNRTYETRWTDEDLVAIAVEFLKTAPIPTYIRFSEWLGARDEYPSAVMTRIRLGGWSDIRALALHELADDDKFWDSLVNTPADDTLASAGPDDADDTPDPLTVPAAGEPDALLDSSDFAYLDK